MTDNKLGVCIVGAGAMGARHADCWRKVPGARIVAVSDVFEPLAEKLAQTHGADSYRDYRMAIIQPNVDVVSVCVPTNLHPAVTIFAAEQGKHVLCEKPIALTLAEAEAMIAAADRNKIKLSIGLMRRYSPALHSLRDYVTEGRLGHPLLYQASIAIELRPKRAMHDARANGGPIIDMGVHFFDTWAYVFGARPVSVYAQGFAMAQRRPELAHITEIAYDSASITVNFETGDIGTCVLCWGGPPGVKSISPADQVYGPNGMARLMLYGYSETQVFQVKTGDAWQTLAVGEDNMYHREIAGFAQAVRTDQPPLVTGQEGRAALKVSLAALESIRTGQLVALK